MTENLIEITGQIEKITFFNEENGFTIARIAVADRRDFVTVVGNLIAPEAGQFIKVSGEWTRHPRFGEQFKILHSESILPFTVAGIEKYLASGLIQGIGPVTAERIIGKFGADSLEIMEKTPDRLLEVEGIGKVRLRRIKKAWGEQKEIRNLILFLQDHGLGSGYAARIFKEYGENAINILRSNPYRLAADVAGIGFLTADRIAEKLGFDKKSRFRVETGILYTLNRLAESGHVFYPYAGLVQTCRELLRVEDELIEAAIRETARNGMIVIEDRIDEKGVYPAGLYQAECRVASRIKILAKPIGANSRVDPERALAWAQQKLKIRLADRQSDAVKCAVTEKMMVITGGPGTGKTTIIRVILEIFKRSGLDVRLAAPTGRAAKRMTEATGHDAATIHRVLEFNPMTGRFQRDQDNPLDCDLMIVDEASMIDIILMKQLLAALSDGIKLILVGDIHQLPSVGPGNVLRDIISSRRVPVIELDEVFRQARESAIVMNAHRVLCGSLPVVASAGGQPGDFYFIERNDPRELLGTVLDLIRNRIPAHFGFDPVEDIQLISPMNKGDLGTIRLNQELQAALNPSGAEINRGGRSFRIGDKIMQIRNNYDKEVFNGDIGRIAGFDRESNRLRASFDGRGIVYDFNELDELAHAYAISVHKSQGSEYPAVIIPLMTSHYMMLQRNLIYTAVTRGKKLVVLIGSRKALAIGVKNEKTQQRFTFLRERLTEAW